MNEYVERLINEIRQQSIIVDQLNIEATAAEKAAMDADLQFTHLRGTLMRYLQEGEGAFYFRAYVESQTKTETKETE